MDLLASKGRSHIRYRCNYSINFRIAHGGKERQGEYALVFRFGIRQVSRLVAERILIKRVQVKGNEMDAGAYAALLQFGNKPVSIDGKLLQPEPKDIKMPGALAVSIIMRNFKARNLFESSGIALHYGLPGCA